MLRLWLSYPAISDCLDVCTWCQLSLDCTDGMICDLDVGLLQGGAPPSFLMLVVDIVEVDYVHLQSDTSCLEETTSKLWCWQSAYRTQPACLV